MAFFWGQNIGKIVWRPGSIWTRWEAYSVPPEPLAGFERVASWHWQGKKGRGEAEGGREGGKRMLPRFSHPSCAPAAKEVVYLSKLVCLPLSRITQK